MSLETSFGGDEQKPPLSTPPVETSYHPMVHEESRDKPVPSRIPPENAQQTLHDPAALNEAGGVAFRRYQRSGQEATLHQAVKYWQEALALTPSDSPELSDRLSNLGAGLRALYICIGSLADLEAAINAWERAAQATPTDSLGRPGYLTNLGAGLMDRYHSSAGMASDLDKALQAFELAVQSTPADAPEKPGRLNNLGNGLRGRYMLRGVSSDLDAAIKTWELAVQTVAVDRPNRAIYLNSLSVGLSDRYTQTGALADLEAALAAIQEAIQATPLGSPNRPMYLNTLGYVLSYNYKRTGLLAELEAAVATWKEAVQNTPFDSPHLPTYLASLSNGLSDLHQHTGALIHLEASLVAIRKAIQLTSPNSPDLPRYLNGFGCGLSDRYKRTQQMEDLEMAIKVWEQAIQFIPAHSPELAACLNNLGNGLRDHYKRIGDLSKLEAALQAYAGSLQHSSGDSPDRPRYLTNLANGLGDLYARTNNLEHLEMSLQIYAQAIQSTSPDSPDLAESMNNFGEGLRERFLRTKEQASLETALHSYELAIESTLPDSFDRSRYLNNLGRALIDRYNLTGLPDDLNAAIKAWEESWSAHQFQFATLPVVYQLGQQQRNVWIATALVAAYLEREQPRRQRAARVIPRVLELVEGSKSRLLTQLVGRGPLPEPVGLAPGIAERELHLLAELTELDALELASHHPVSIQGEVSHLQRLQQRQTILSELEDLWTQIMQTGPGGSEYVILRRGTALTWREFTDLTRNLGPTTALCSFFITVDRALLFLLRTGWRFPRVFEVSLDQTGWKSLLAHFFHQVHHLNVQTKQMDYGSFVPRSFRLDQQEATLPGQESWDQLLCLLLTQAQPHLKGMERIIFAPAGNGHLLPWGVLAERAGWHTSTGQALPLITLPALSVLPRLRRRQRVSSGSVLVVGNPCGNLFHAETEANVVANRFGTHALLGATATKAAVLAHFSEATLIHLATHAFFDADNPLESGIVLADGVLTAREILKNHLQADLLVLSSCESGQVGSLGGEEFAGLSQAFLQAGVRSLLVSLWKVDDPATAALMQAFYSIWQETPADKAQALREAMTRIQQDPRWEHFHYWGAFTLVGDWD